MAKITITKDNFENEVLKAKAPVILDFWASWCGPCSMISPILDEIAQENAEKIIGKVNVDEEPELAALFQIDSIPTLVAFKDGKAVSKTVGVRSKEEIVAMF